MKHLLIAFFVFIAGIGCQSKLPKDNPSQYGVKQFDYTKYASFGTIWFNSNSNQYGVRVGLGNEPTLLIDEIDSNWYQTDHIPISISNSGKVKLLPKDDNYDQYLDNYKYTIEDYDIEFVNANQIKVYAVINWGTDMERGGERIRKTYNFTAYLVDKNEEE